MPRAAYKNPDPDIEEDPNHPGPADVVLAPSGVPVWAVISYLDAVEGSTGQVARDYDVPVESVEAALRYYRRHKKIITARICANTVCSDLYL